MTQFKEGQSVYVVMNRNGGNAKYESTVTKIGLKWGYIGFNERFSLEGGWIDAGEYMSPGVVYQNEQEYLDEQALINAWRELRDSCSGIGSMGVPSHLTTEEIKAMTAKIKGPE